MCAVVDNRVSLQFEAKYKYNFRKQMATKNIYVGLYVSKFYHLLLNISVLFTFCYTSTKNKNKSGNRPISVLAKKKPLFYIYYLHLLQSSVSVSAAAIVKT